jgi:hypothetical protein
MFITGFLIGHSLVQNPLLSISSTMRISKVTLLAIVLFGTSALALPFAPDGTKYDLEAREFSNDLYARSWFKLPSGPFWSGVESREQVEKRREEARRDPDGIGKEIEKFEAMSPKERKKAIDAALHLANINGPNRDIYDAAKLF